MTAPELVTVIGAVAAAAVSIINGINSSRGRSEAREKTAVVAAQTNGKLDQIHELTNSTMTALKEELAVAHARISVLEQAAPQTSLGARGTR